MATTSNRGSPGQTLASIGGPVREMLYAIRRSSSATVGLVLVLALIVIALSAPIIAPSDPIKPDFMAIDQAPSSQHLLGTDQLGRDILSRIIYGARLSLLLGIGSVMLGAVTGIPMGLLAGYRGGWIDDVCMRVIDILLAFRLLLLSIAIVAFLGASLLNVVIAIGVSLFATFTRLTRGEVLSAKGVDYVEAAEAAGATSVRIMFRHVLPNIAGPLLVYATLRLGTAILAEASLSFLGLGASPPTPTWGLMVKEGLGEIRSAWWTTATPGFAIMVTVLAFNLLGDGLRDALDPRLARRRATREPAATVDVVPNALGTSTTS
ncbi:MAG TPA: ABC transporter permease [Nitrolancea sp.]|nr:ABC transporter permease [Nitrolancea sp.]